MVKAKVDQMLAEAEKGLKSPTGGAYKVLQGWCETSGDGDPASKREIGLDFQLTSLLDPKWQDQPIPPDKRAAVEALPSATRTAARTTLRSRSCSNGTTPAEAPGQDKGGVARGAEPLPGSPWR
jgi:hypothetical protein